MATFRRVLRPCTLFLHSYRSLCSSTSIEQLSGSFRERLLQIVAGYESAGKGNHGYKSALGRFKNWAVENKGPPTRDQLQMLFQLCSTSGCSSDIDLIQSYVSTHGLSLTDGQVNSLLAGMAKSGEYSKAKEMYSKMEGDGVQLRLSAFCVLLQQAAAVGDFPMVLKLSRQLNNYKESVNKGSQKIVDESFQRVFRECEGVQDKALMEAAWFIVDSFRTSRRKLSHKMADVFSYWIRSFPQFSIMETTVSGSGVCSGCGLKLGDGDVSPDELQLLRKYVETTLLTDAKMSADIEAEVVKLEALRAVIRNNKFGAILDGQNIAHVLHSGRPTIQNVVSVAEEVVKVTGKPALALMRRHCIKWFTSISDRKKAMAEIAALYQPRGLHCFFTNNFDEDDLYLLYATMFSEPSTLMVTNDHQGCNKHRLPVESHETFQQWLRGRLANVVGVRNRVRIKYPRPYDDVVQWIPQESGPSSSWGHLHVPLNYFDRWLCISQQHEHKNNSQNITQQ